MLFAIYRDDFIFMIVYGALYVLITIWLVTLWFRFGVLMYVPKNSDAARQFRRFTKLSMTFLVAANLYAVGATVAFSQYIGAALMMGRSPRRNARLRNPQFFSHLSHPPTTAPAANDEMRNTCL